MVTVRPQPEARFNVLLTEDRPHAEEHWTSQLPRLLHPQGVATYVARSGREAVVLAERMVIHAAVIDLGTPADLADATGSTAADRQALATAPAGPAGLWLLELFRRLRHRPPMVVLRGPAQSRAHAERMLAEALRLGAFSVLDKPIGLEQLLAVFQRLVERQYRGQWPRPGTPRPDTTEDDA